MTWVVDGSQTFILALTFLFVSSVGVFFMGKNVKTVRLVTLLGGVSGNIFAFYSSIFVLFAKQPIILKAWPLKPDFQFILHMDALSAVFILMISFIGLIASWYGYGYTEKFVGKKRLDLMGALSNSFIAMMMIVITSDHFITFLIAWESMSILSYLLVVTDYEKPYVQRAGFIYIVMTHIGTLFIILGFFYLHQLTGTSQISQLFSYLSGVDFPGKDMIFIFFLIGFGTKAGIFPLHVWLPRAHPIAPSHISALMSGVMIKTALYGIIRFVIQIFSFGELWWAYLIILLGILSAVMGALFGVIEKDMKRYLAYSSSENMGLMWMMLGVAMIFIHKQEAVLGILSFSIVILHMFNHSIFKSLLFLGAGSIDYAAHTKNMNLLGGLIHRMPVTGIMVLFGVMGMAAVPPFNGFYSEWSMMRSFFNLYHINSTSLPLLGILLTISLGLVGALTVAGTVNLFGNSFLGKARSANATYAKEVSFHMLLPMAVLAILVVLFGLGATWLVKWLQDISGFILFSFNQKAEVPLLHDLVVYTVQPILLGAILLFIIFTTLLLTRWVYGRPMIKVSPTWGCGINLDRKMEYTASSYTHFILVFFSQILRPVQAHSEGHSHYFPKKIQFKIGAKSILDLIIYRPILQGLFWLAGQIKKVQNGNIQTYLLFMFVTLILFLMFAK